MRQSTLDRLWDRVRDVRAGTDDLGDGIIRLRITSRRTRALGFEVSAYLVDDLLVDTGFRHARGPVLDALAGRTIRAICCTHSHEDHTGNCWPLAERHGCPVYLSNHALRWTEGVRRLKPYRLWWWGVPGPIPAEEMPEVVVGRRRRLRALPAPGHAVTHVALWEQATGSVFTGDLFIASGASAVMVQENPYDLADSLRRVAALQPRRMLTGHGLVVDDPTPRLLAKADRVEEAAARAVELHRSGMPDRAIVRELFANGHLKDRILEALTQGEFARVNFVRAAVLHCPDQ